MLTKNATTNPSFCTLDLAQLDAVGGGQTARTGQGECNLPSGTGAITDRQRAGQNAVDQHVFAIDDPVILRARKCAIANAAGAKFDAATANGGLVGAVAPLYDLR